MQNSLDKNSNSYEPTILAPQVVIKKLPLTTLPTFLTFNSAKHFTGSLLPGCNVRANISMMERLFKPASIWIQLRADVRPLPNLPSLRPPLASSHALHIFLRFRNFLSLLTNT